MAKAYSMDLRGRVVAACDAGKTTIDVARQFQVSARWVRKLLQRRRNTGSFSALNGRTGPKPKLVQHIDRLRKLVKQRPDATLEELRQSLPVKVSIGTLWSALRGMNLVLKKSHPRGGTAAA